MGQGVVPTPLTDVPFIGDKLTYDQFSMTFMVDEKLKNFIELHDWLVNIGFPSDHADFNAKARPDQFKRPSHQTYDPEVAGFGLDSDRDLYCNIDLFILSSKNNPVV